MLAEKPKLDEPRPALDVVLYGSTANRTTTGQGQTFRCHRRQPGGWHSFSVHMVSKFDQLRTQ